MQKIASKLIQVMAECSQIPKNGVNDFHHYKYATSADVLEKVNSALVKHKLASVVTPEVLQASEVLNSKGISQLKDMNIIATLLPGCSYFLNMVYPPARKLIENAVPVALATDFNPGSCNTENIQMIMSLASLKMKMSAEEIINAVTINGAFALNIQNKTGSLTPGKLSDILVFDFPDYKDLIYHFGVNQLVKVFKKGKSIL